MIQGNETIQETNRKDKQNQLKNNIADINVRENKKIMDCKICMLLCYCIIHIEKNYVGGTTSIANTIFSFSF